MNAAAKLGGFGAVLAVLFGGGALAGAALGPDRGDDEPAPVTHGHGATATADAAGATEPAGHGGGHEGAASGDAVRGLGVSDGRLRLELDTPELTRGTAAQLAFRIVGRDGEVVEDFDVEHTKRMHLIVVRRDLTGFQHLHPRQRPDGSWATRVRLPEAGTYRVLADFAHRGRATTLAADLRVDGAADLRALPAPATVARDGDYEVRLDAGRVRAGREAQLRFDVTRDGQPVHVEPYLGADGHLVALREGDLAFLHVHPTAHGGDDHGAGHDDAVGFAATFPTAGRYRLFLQVRHDGEVRTVAYTLEVAR